MLFENPMVLLGNIKPARLEEDSPKRQVSAMILINLCTNDTPGNPENSPCHSSPPRMGNSPVGCSCSIYTYKRHYTIMSTLVTSMNKEKFEYWKLNALYGLKQAGHEWFKTLQKILQLVGLKQCIGDEGTYTSSNGQLIIGSHVDDLLGIAPTETDLDKVEQSVEKHVELDKRGKLSKLLGMELTWKKGGVILTQHTLIESMSQTFPYTSKRTLPMGILDYAAKDPSEPPTDQKRYQSLIGGLLFIGWMTRPEISLHVNLLGRRATEPSERNMRTALQVLEYLKSIPSEGITIKKPTKGKLSLEIFADASYGGMGARSQTGVLMTFGGQPVEWYSRRQDIVALSITEVEYIADCKGAKDASWGQQFLQELSVSSEIPILKTDSEGAYNLSQTAKFLRRSRHIEHQYHYLRQQVQSEKLAIYTIPGKENPADVLTKLTPMSSILAWKQRWLNSTGQAGTTS